MAIKQYSFQIEKDKNYINYVKNNYGENAQIVTVTQITGRTPTTPAMVEVVVAVEEDNFIPKTKMIDKRAVAGYQSSFDSVDLDNLENNRLSSPNSSDKMINFIDLEPKDRIRIPTRNEKSEKMLSEISNKIDLVMNMRWKEIAPDRNYLEIPPEFAIIYNKAKNSEMLQEHLDEIMIHTLKNMPLSLYKNKDTIDRYFKILLKSMIPCRVDSVIRKQKIIMLVGPTGVGKTTTLAKLAYRYAYGARRYQTAIISLDNFRLGAKEQLAEYAQVMRLPIRFVSSADELQRDLEELSGYDVILIDSTGNSQYDKSKIEQLEGYLRASDKEIEVNLVLNAGMKYGDMEQTYQAFDVLKIETLIFTKFDETRAFGNIFSLIFNVKKPVSFFSTGQNVPDDIMVATSDYLIKCLLEGFEG